MSDETGTGLSKTQTAPLAVAPSMSAGQMYSSLLDAARDPSVDPSKMEALVNLQMKMMDRALQEEFSKAKIAALFEMPSITKRGAIKNKQGGVQSRFSKFEDIHRAVMPVLKRNGLVISFNVGNAGNMVTVQPILSHINGFIERGNEMALPIDTTGSKNGTQGAGSSSSYGKRYTMVAMLNIIEDGTDMDGREDAVRIADRFASQEGELREASKRGGAALKACMERMKNSDSAAYRDLFTRPYFKDDLVNAAKSADTNKTDDGDDFPGDRPFNEDA